MTEFNEVPEVLLKEAHLRAKLGVAITLLDSLGNPEEIRLGFYQNCDDWLISGHHQNMVEVTHGNVNCTTKQWYRARKSKSNGQSIRCIKD